MTKMSLIILLSLLAISYLVYFVWKYRIRSNNNQLSEYRNTPKKSPKVIPGCLPLIGRPLLFFGDNIYIWNVFKQLNEFSNENGGFIQGYLGPITFYGVTDLDGSLEIANRFLDKPYLYKFIKNVFFNGLITAKSDIWKHHRKLLNPVFSSQMLKAFMKMFNERSHDLVSTLSKQVGKHAFDVRPYLIKNSLEISSQTTLGISPQNGSIVGETYGQGIQELMAMFMERLKLPLLHLPFFYNFSSLKKKQDKLMKVTTDIVNLEIQKRKIMMKKEIEVGTTDQSKLLLDTVLDLNEKGIFSDEDVLGHLNTIVSASVDSSASALMVILQLLGTHQDVQDRVYQEIQDILGDRDVTQQDLLKMVYLEAVVKEALRLYPVVPIIARHITTDTTIKDYTLKAGSICIIGLYGINRLPLWGKDADHFRPERWLEPDSLPANPNLFASFSLGKRYCIGRYYGMMAMKTTIAHIIRRYRIHGDINKLVMKFELFLKPASGHEISLELRD